MQTMINNISKSRNDFFFLKARVNRGVFFVNVLGKKVKLLQLSHMSLN